MKALLICPGERTEVPALAESAPLSNLPILGKSLIEYWLEHLVSQGAKEVCVLATDRPEQVRSLVGTGARWGLRIEVIPQIRELTAAEARQKYRVPRSTADWLAAPADATVMNHLPGYPEFPLFTSYGDWMGAQQAFMPHAKTPHRLGIREIKPGVWAGLHARIAPEAELHAPCWIGDEVFIGAHAVVGPQAVIERRALVESGAIVSHSVVGEETFVGKFIELHDSIAFGNTLTNWKLNSSVRIADAFLLCSLTRRRSGFKRPGLAGRAAALLLFLLTFPFALLVMTRSAFRGLPFFNSKAAVRPRTAPAALLPDERIIYHELADTRGWLVRWPQLWGIVRGDFTWVGNRPLTPLQAAQLTNDFERLWLAAPLGLICLADVHGVYDAPSNDARAHASFYSVRASRRLDASIFAGAMFRFVFGFPYSRVRDAVLRGYHSLVENQRKAT